MINMINEIAQNWVDYAIFGGTIVGSIIAGILMYYLGMFIIKKVASKTKTELDNVVVMHLKSPLKLFFPVMIFYLVIPLSAFNVQFLSISLEVLGILFIISFAWILLKITSIVEDRVKYKFNVNVKDNLSARKIQTQMHVLKRIIVIIIVIVSTAVILMRFEEVQQWGATILASAGIVGLIIGFAAQKTLSTLVAGFQIAFTQPIRIDDVIIAENEWGRIEEITLTYVVMRIWDQRRLIIPINYFIEKPFQNWTRSTAELLGTVYLYCDYTIPLENVRVKLREICEASPRWDKKVCMLQITDSKETTLELRILVSAADSSSAWDLRCEVREKLITYIQENFEQHLPKVRASLVSQNSKVEKG
jgi:small-conductance mechanosensitive channel